MKNLDSVRCGVRYAAVPLTLAALAGCSEGRTKRPNIIVMMTDDHTTQAMSCYGSLLVETPNLDRLAREGMLFESCYVPNAISGPSRACILPGKYSHVNGFTDNYIKVEVAAAPELDNRIVDVRLDSPADDGESIRATIVGIH